MGLMVGGSDSHLTHPPPPCRAWGQAVFSIPGLKTQWKLESEGG